MKINYDLLNGKIYMEDMKLVVNPYGIDASFIPDQIQHYSMINAKLKVLEGEEYRRLFDYRLVVTNPNAISEIEEEKNKVVNQRLQQWIMDSSQSEEESNEELQKISDYFTYEWQDLREVRANSLLNHYVKEYDMPLMFNQGFMDAMTIAEEIYQCDIRGGEPIIERVNPLKIRVFKSGYSNRIEDADIIIIEDYWSPSKVIDAYYDVLTKKDIEYIEKAPDQIGQSAVDSMDNVDERFGFVHASMIDDQIGGKDEFFFDPFNLFSDTAGSLLPFDTAGNIRVLRMYWKSGRRIKKIKKYDPQTGEEEFHFYPETYIPNKVLGEEEEIFWVNEAWEGTKIGTDIYVNIRPRPIQFN
jgi:hypothetical protein